MNGAEVIAARRMRQIEHHGYPIEHDTGHGSFELSTAAVLILDHVRGIAEDDRTRVWEGVPYPVGDDVGEDLANAGALISAELDRVLADRRELDGGPDE